MIDKKELSEYILENKHISVPELMMKKSVSYKEARGYLKNLQSAGVVKSVGNMTYELENAVLVACRFVLTSRDAKVTALLSANNAQYEGLRAVYSSAKLRSGEFSMMAMRRFRSMVDESVWDWLIDNRVINDSFVLLMDKTSVLSVITYLKLFVYN